MMLFEVNDLLVMSVYNRASLPWMSLQKRFLDSTTKVFKFVVFLNHVEDHELLEGIDVIGISNEKQGGALEHMLGLTELLRFAKTTNYKHYLILDSDCFPIASNWQAILDPYLNTYDGVNAVRAENCSSYSHPCICYFNDPMKINFEIKEHYDFKGDVKRDVTCVSRKHFPLLRTNKRNRHLLAAAIYFDLFYHHGCGSRDFNMRGMYYYPKFLLDKNENPDKLREELFANPVKFLETLTKC